MPEENEADAIQPDTPEITSNDIVSRLDPSERGVLMQELRQAVEHESLEFGASGVESGMGQGIARTWQSGHTTAFLENAKHGMDLEYQYRCGRETRVLIGGIVVTILVVAFIAFTFERRPEYAKEVIAGIVLLVSNVASFWFGRKTMHP